MKRKTLSKLKKDCWSLLSKITRLEASDPQGYASCFTCGLRAHWKDLQGEHAIPGQHGAVLLNPDVIRVQCYRCNIALHGNYPIFTTRLIKEHGMEWWEDQLMKSRQTVHQTRSDLETKLEGYKRRLAELG